MKEILEVFIGGLLAAIPVIAILGLARLFLALFKIVAYIGGFIFMIYLLFTFSCSAIKHTLHKKENSNLYRVNITQQVDTLYKYN